MLNYSETKTLKKLPRPNEWFTTGQFLILTLGEKKSALIPFVAGQVRAMTFCRTPHCGVDCSKPLWRGVLYSFLMNQLATSQYWMGSSNYKAVTVHCSSSVLLVNSEISILTLELWFEYRGLPLCIFRLSGPAFESQLQSYFCSKYFQCCSANCQHTASEMDIWKAYLIWSSTSSTC